MWDGSPAASNYLLRFGVETHRGRVVWRGHTLGGQQRKVISECPGGARKAFKDCSDNEAVRSRR